MSVRNLFTIVLDGRTVIPLVQKTQFQWFEAPVFNYICSKAFRRLCSHSLGGRKREIEDILTKILEIKDSLQLKNLINLVEEEHQFPSKK